MARLYGCTLAVYQLRPADALTIFIGGNYDVAAPVQTHDEIGELGYAMNEMIAGLAERERIRDAFGRAVTPEVRDYLVEQHLPSLPSMRPVRLYTLP